MDDAVIFSDLGNIGPTGTDVEKLEPLIRPMGAGSFGSSVLSNPPEAAVPQTRAKTFAGQRKSLLK